MENLDEILDRIMMPRETLDLRLFDYKEEMLPEVREGLLKIVEPVIQKVFVPIKGLEVYDICLCGSSASYFYHDESDIDLRIELRNKNCPYLSEDKLLTKFVSILMMGFYKKNRIGGFNGRFVDLKASSKKVDRTGVYSILNNKWRVYPRQDALSKFSKVEILEMYKKQKAKIQTEIYDLRKNLTGKEFADHLYDLYIAQFNFYDDLKNYLVFKLLCKTKVIRKLGSLIFRIWHRELSLYTQEELEKMKTFRKPSADNTASDHDDIYFGDVCSDDIYFTDSISL